MGCGYNPIPTNRLPTTSPIALLLLCHCFAVISHRFSTVSLSFLLLLRYRFAIALRAEGALCGPSGPNKKQGPDFRRSP
mgnify:CR=1 FL=1|jgi:hypothetical protein